MKPLDKFTNEIAQELSRRLFIRNSSVAAMGLLFAGNLMGCKKDKENEYSFNDSMDLTGVDKLKETLSTAQSIDDLPDEFKTEALNIFNDGNDIPFDGDQTLVKKVTDSFLDYAKNNYLLTDLERTKLKNGDFDTFDEVTNRLTSIPVEFENEISDILLQKLENSFFSTYMTVEKNTSSDNEVYNYLVLAEEIETIQLNYTTELLQRISDLAINKSTFDLVTTIVIIIIICIIVAGILLLIKAITIIQKNCMWQTTKFIKQILYITIMFLYTVVSESQSLEGITGCVNIPTAIIPSDGSVLLGVSYWSQLDQPTYPKKNATAYYADMAYFPWCEVVYRRTMSKDERLGDYSDHDRMASIKVRCFRQSKYTPAFAFGINDIFTASGSGNLYYYSCYGVVSRELKLSSFAFLPTLGYGFSINRRKSYLDAWFGGIDVSMEKLKNFHLLMDYDTHQLNLGIRQKLFDRIYVIGAFHLKSGFSVGVIYQIHLIQ